MTQLALFFKEAIVSSATKPISTKDLLTRLEQLFHKLSELDQEEIDTVSFESIKDDLVNKKLLKNSNRGVQIYTACCIADILRLYAPDAPYDDLTLQAIFKLFMLQFDYLDDQDSPYYQQYVYLLRRVAEIKLIALMTDLESSTKMILQLFEKFYALSSLKEFDLESLQPYLIEILSEVITEVDQLDSKILKLMLNKFLANSKNLKNQNNIKVPGFEISLALCELNTDKLSRLITYFFSEMILEATTDNTDDRSDNMDSENSDSEDELPNVDIEQLKKIHTLAVELWRYVPEILTAVLSLFDTELEAENEIIKTIATDTISKILTVPISRVNFPTTFVSTYTNWLKKPLDISVSLRITWIKGIANILEARNDITSDIVKGLLKTLLDSSDKVRLATIIELSKLKPSTFLERLTSDSLLETLLKLLREKNLSIRKEVINFLSTIYNFSAENDLYKQASLTRKIPNHILNLVYINDNQINSEVHIALFEKILPFDSSNFTRVSRFLFLISILEEKSKTSLYALLKRQSQFSKVILHLLSVLEDDLNFEKEDMMKRAIEWISKSFPVPHEAETSLQGFFNMGNKRLIRLLRLCATETSDYDTLVSSMKEILNRVNNTKLTGSEEFTNNGNLSSHNIMKLLLLMCSNVCYNIDNVKELINLNNDSRNPYNKYIRETLERISDQCPDVLTSSVKTVCKKINEQSISLSTRSLTNANDLWKDLKIAYNAVATEGSKIKFETGFYNNLVAYSTEGSTLEAKFAIKLINCASYDIKDLLFMNIVNKIWPLKMNSPYFNTHLSALSTLFLCDFLSVEHIKEELSRFLASEILLKNHPSEQKKQQEDKETSWISDDDLYYDKSYTLCLSKILTMKLLSNWLVSIREHNSDEIEDVSKPILSMLSSFINRGGEIVSSEDTPSEFCCRLRLHAGIQMLKIAQYPAYDKFIDQRRINRLILLIQDVEYEVREKFITKLKKYLSTNTISKRFMTLIFMAAFEPNFKLKSQTSTWIRSCFNKHTSSSLNCNENFLFEKSYPRLLYMILNHPEFKELYQSYQSTEDSRELNSIFQELSTFAITYIVYYLTLVLTPDNISLLFYFSERMKQFKIIPLLENDPVLDSGLYMLAEISQIALKYVAKLHGWSISIWPNKFNLPHDLFEALGSEDANEIVTTTFISGENVEIISGIIRSKWRVERSSNTIKKTRKRLLNNHLSEYAKDFDNIQAKKDLAAKRRKKKVETEVSSEDDNENLRMQDENTPPVVFRRSKRSKRINYTEV